jgi:hypothetical protein
MMPKSCDFRHRLIFTVIDYMNVSLSQFFSLPYDTFPFLFSKLIDSHMYRLRLFFGALS